MLENPKDITSVEEFAIVINSKYPRAVKNKAVIIIYVNERGDKVHRSFKFYTFEDLVDQIIYTQSIDCELVSKDNTIEECDIIGEPMDVDFSEFVIRYQMLSGGGTRSYHTIKSEYFKARSYPSKDNNCLIVCVTNMINPESGRWGRHEKIREKIGLIHNELIGLEQIKDVEDYFKTNINVYEDSITIKTKYYDNPKADIYITKVDIEYTILKKSVNRYINSIDVLLKDSHYSVIIDRKQIKICPQTGDIIKKKYSKKKIKKRLIEQGRYKYPLCRITIQPCKVTI